MAEPPSMPAPANGPYLASSNSTNASSPHTPECSPTPAHVPAARPAARSSYARAPRSPPADLTPPPWPATLVKGDLHAAVLVTDSQAITALWSTTWRGGSYGTGTLSRSEPTWWARTQARLDPNRAPTSRRRRGPRRTTGNEFAEDVALARKDARRQARAGGGGAEEGGGEGVSVPPAPSLVDAATARAQQLATENDLNPNLEQLQLLPEEAMFLALHGMLHIASTSSTSSQVTLDDMWATLRFATCRHAAARFAAYHAWRSRDPPWVPKCGLKYGADFVLYSKGPNHGHAPFAVRIVPVKTADQVGQLPNQQDDATTASVTVAAHHGVTWLQSALRVVTHSKKKLLLCYVVLGDPNNAPPSPRLPLAHSTTSSSTALVRANPAATLFTAATVASWSGTLALWQMMWFWLWLVHLGTTRAWTVLVSNEPRALPAPSEEKAPGPRYDWRVVVDVRRTPVHAIEVGRWSPDRNRE
ncbi:hypothetical protein AMAG_12372 [Allomyces macrogynus ATCC 38327]|uniref:tRNA-intron lyase n=1 Tax=Allomyces macrogynus (strain ATCC 38327) TaxID=578462 RepID=A0A0L0SXT8_ALLM3|nr:hypothetical protein AMAG_12372 [Allomyces macrogynus ATCC 38327]|eukprot:KNE67306.1 hypothetical protein AMAG_12372 [Allomyces macrogynus ATCC 38327]